MKEVSSAKAAATVTPVVHRNKVLELRRSKIEHDESQEEEHKEEASC